MVYCVLFRWIISLYDDDDDDDDDDGDGDDDDDDDYSAFVVCIFSEYCMVECSG